MYGDPRLNEASMLKYAWTYDFFQSFRKLRYRGIELPPVLMRSFHGWIRSDVDRYRKQGRLVANKTVESGLTQYRDVQARLLRPDHLRRNLSRYRHRRILLLPGALYPFAARHLAGERILFLLNGKKDRKFIAGWRMHPTFDVFDFRKAARRILIPASVKRKLMHQFKQIAAEKDEHELFSRPAFRRWAALRLHKVLRYIKVLDQMLKKHPVGVIVHYNELDPPGSILASLAHKYGLPFMFVQMHLLSDASVTPARASRYFVWGTPYKNWLVNKGVAAHRILPTGSMLLEPLTKIDRRRHFSIRDKLRIPANRTVILWTTQSFKRQVNLNLVRWFRSAARLLPVTIIVKPHPSDKLDYTKQLRDTNVILCPSTIRLHEVMHTCDAVATISSTTAIEAALLGKKLLILQPHLPYHYYKNYNSFHQHLAKAAAGKVIRSSFQLYKALDQLIHESHVRSELERMRARFVASTLNVSGSPAARIAAVLKNEINRKRQRIPRKSRRIKA